jgi:hypothetical protein
MGAKELQELLQSPGWARLDKLLANICRCRRDAILRQNDPGLDGLIELAKDKQELAGIEFVRAFPASIINMYKEESEQLIIEGQSHDQNR